MNPALIPLPKHTKPGVGRLALPALARVALRGSGLDNVLKAAQRLFTATALVAESEGPLLTLALGAHSSRGGHDLEVSEQGIRISGDSPEALFNGLQTLRQWMLLHTGPWLPTLSVSDWPEYAVRGVSYDVSRGRVPKLERLIELVGLLGLLKVNQLQLYIERTFSFQGHPLIGQGALPLTHADIAELDRACRERFIDLVPSFACFGHMNRILELAPYRHLAEDLAQGRYKEPGFDRHRAGLGHLPDAWTLAPEAPGAMDLISSLLDEYLPLFSSGKFNACCDEPFDLGRGQSWPAVEERGVLDVYIGHLRRLQQVAGRHGKSLLVWGDVLKNHPLASQQLPRDITVLDWDYRFEGDFGRIRDFVEPGYLAYACPSVNGWGSFFPRLSWAMANISSFARAGREAGAVGLLNTEWGDGGHFNFLENSWHGLAYGAECAWNLQAEALEFTRRFCRLFIGSEDPALASAWLKLGDLAAWHRAGGVEDYLTEAYFALPDAAVFKPGAKAQFEGGAGRVTQSGQALGPELARRLGAELAQVREALVGAQAQGPDPRGWLDYAIFACDAMAHGAHKAVGTMGRASLALEASQLMERFQALWLARNRPSEIALSLDRMDACIAALKGEPQALLTGKP